MMENAIVDLREPVKMIRCLIEIHDKIYRKIQMFLNIKIKEEL